MQANRRSKLPAACRRPADVDPLMYMTAAICEDGHVIGATYGPGQLPPKSCTKHGSPVHTKCAQCGSRIQGAPYGLASYPGFRRRASATNVGSHTLGHRQTYVVTRADRAAAFADRSQRPRVASRHGVRHESFVWHGERRAVRASRNAAVEVWLDGRSDLGSDQGLRGQGPRGYAEAVASGTAIRSIIIALFSTTAMRRSLTTSPRSTRCK